MYKRILLSHKYTGVSVEELSTLLPVLKKTLSQFADDVFCSYEHIARMEEQQRTPEQNYQRCLEQQCTCDAVVGFLHYDTPSRGMEQELVLAKERAQPYFLLKRSFAFDPAFISLYTDAATDILEYGSFDELLERLKTEWKELFAVQTLSSPV